MNRLTSDKFDTFSSNHYQHHNLHNLPIFSPGENDVTCKLDRSWSSAPCSRFRIYSGAETVACFLVFLQFQYQGLIRYARKIKVHDITSGSLLAPKNINLGHVYFSVLWEEKNYTAYNHPLTTRQGNRFPSCVNIVSRSQTSSLPPAPSCKPVCNFWKLCRNQMNALRARVFYR